MDSFLTNYLGIAVMVLGGLVALIGVLLLVNHSGGAKVIGGIVLAALGLAGVGVGYTLDQHVEVTYTVSEITEVSARDTNQVYRVTLKSEAGTDTWIYLNDNQIAAFPEGEQVTLKKSQVKMYKDQDPNASK